MSIELPPTPATELDARKLANQLAYGFEKHKDDYWADRYEKDRTYYWKRMLGWQSEGGPDQAVFGYWADPPTPWNYPAPEQKPEPVEPVDVQASNEKLDAVLVALGQIQETLKTVATQDDIRDARNEMITAAKDATAGLGAIVPFLRKK